jgi:hypothetical protein
LQKKDGSEHGIWFHGPVMRTHPATVNRVIESNLSREGRRHLTGTFTFGGGATKEELDEIIRRSFVLWPNA